MKDENVKRSLKKYIVHVFNTDNCDHGRHLSVRMMHLLKIEQAFNQNPGESAVTSLELQFRWKNVWKHLQK